MKAKKVLWCCYKYLVQMTVQLVQSNLKIYQMIWAVHFLYVGMYIPFVLQLSPASSELHLAVGLICLSASHFLLFSSIAWSYSKSKSFFSITNCCDSCSISYWLLIWFWINSACKCYTLLAKDSLSSKSYLFFLVNCSFFSHNFVFSILNSSFTLFINQPWKL